MTRDLISMKKQSKQIARAHAFKAELTSMTRTQIQRFDKGSVQHYYVHVNHQFCIAKQLAAVLNLIEVSCYR